MNKFANFNKYDYRNNTILPNNNFKQDPITDYSDSFVANPSDYISMGQKTNTTFNPGYVNSDHIDIEQIPEGFYQNAKPSNYRVMDEPFYYRQIYQNPVHQPHIYQNPIYPVSTRQIFKEPINNFCTNDNDFENKSKFTLRNVPIDIRKNSNFFTQTPNTQYVPQHKSQPSNPYTDDLLEQSEIKDLGKINNFNNNDKKKYAKYKNKTKKNKQKVNNVKNIDNVKQSSEIKFDASVLKTIAKKVLLSFVEKKLDELFENMEQTVRSFLNSSNFDHLFEEKSKNESNYLKKSNFENFSKKSNNKNIFNEEQLNLNKKYRSINKANEYSPKKNKCVIKHPTQTTMDNIEETIEPYNSKPFDEPISLEDFSKNLINKLVLNNSSTLPNTHDNVKNMQDKIKLYTCDYVGSMNFPVYPSENNLPNYCNTDNKLSNFETNKTNEITNDQTVKNKYEIKKMSDKTTNTFYEPNTKLNNIKIVNNTKDTDEIDNTNDNNDELSNTNVKNKEMIHVNNGIGEKELDSLVAKIVGNCDDNSLNLKNFIYGEILNNLSNKIDESGIKKTIHSLNSLMNNRKITDCKNFVSSSLLNEEEESDEKTDNETDDETDDESDEETDKNTDDESEYNEKNHK